LRDAPAVTDTVWLASDTRKLAAEDR
jgi:hypothetical protein